MSATETQQQYQEPKYEGWLGLDPDSAQGKMVWGTYEPKPWAEDDVEIRVTHCGVCGSDAHVLRSGWGPTPYPAVVGHEIVGVAVRVGSEAAQRYGLRVGDRVGVGAQSDSCQACEDCSSDRENYCPEMVSTYGSIYHRGKAGELHAKTYGGYARYARVPGRFAVRLPEGLDPAVAGPLLCGGVTVYSPLVHFGGDQNGRLDGKSVGVLGVGGLGHMAVLFARALGARKIVGLSRKSDKREDALRLGCDEYVATAEEPGWTHKHARSLDLIISTVSSARGLNIADYLALLKRDGTFVQLGNPDDGPLTVPQHLLIMQRLRIAGSVIGSPKEIRDMLQLVVDKNVRPWIEQRPMSEANQTIVDLQDGKPRYRYVLVNDWSEK